MEKRGGDRRKRRVTCEIEGRAGRTRGIVLDLSPRGLFVQTDTGPALGEPVRVHLRGPGDQALVIDAEVARKRVVPRRLSSVATGGLGLRIRQAPEEFFSLLSTDPPRATPATAPATGGPPVTPPAEVLFRVRVQQCGGPRSRNLLVSAAGEQAARERAMEDLGEEWKVLEVVPA